MTAVPQRPKMLEAELGVWVAGEGLGETGASAGSPVG